ncbi:ribonuclease HII [Fidelibacter multiformis]|jgi:ribonuclease HII|uniref:ribonuclease HII n=1 Tax=Fidelibacter multiformis TaxID=3377529 RepID=UPI0037DC2A15
MVTDNPFILFDRSMRDNPADLLAGVDEAGRGPIFGPVAVAAVVFPLHIESNPLIKDSKKLSEKQRNQAREWILRHALAWSVIFVDHRDIDRMNILQATLYGMKKAVESLSVRPDKILIDGNRIPKGMERCIPVKGGDRHSFSIAAASILAKTARDQYVEECARRYPVYELEKHKGYGTANHIRLLQENLPSPEHRLSFEPVKSFTFPARPDRKILGFWGESWALYTLLKHGFTFIERNVRLQHYGEIDLVMKKGEQFVLVEVKTSGPNDHWEPEEWITEQKIKKMLRLSELYFYKLGYMEYHVRLDVMTVQAKSWRNPVIKHYADIIYGGESELNTHAD